MASQEKQNDETKRLMRMAKAMEAIIRRTLLPRYRLPKNRAYLAKIRSVLEYYQNSCYPMGLADERVADFLLYQIYRLREAISLSKQWDLDWIFSFKGVDKFKSQFLTKEGKSGMRYYIQEWMDDNDLTMETILRFMEEPKPSPLTPLIYMPSEEPIKRRWYNTEMGFLLCLSETTGWSPRSVSCQQCNYKDKCEKETQHKYPELTRLRKETQYGN